MNALFILIGLCAAVFPKTYSTEFDGSEYPLSENGAWSHNGLDWHEVRKDNGIVYGTQTAGGYSDSYALFSGFGADQTAWAVVHMERPIPSDGHSHEAEILLRWTDAAHSAKGYECLFDQGGGVQLVRWNGALGDFTVLNPTSYGSATTVRDGDTLKASVIGNVITMYHNGAKRAQLTDNSYATGNPGIGFCCGTLATNHYYGFTAFSATDGVNTTGENAILNPDRGFFLSQNTPNPFRASTAIRYGLPAQGPAAVEVLDMGGRVIAVLVNGMRSAGPHTVLFDGPSRADGVYFVRLSYGGVGLVRKMLYLK